MNTSNIYRNVTLDKLTEGDVGSTKKVCGWVENIRDHGGVSFIDLRDMYGVLQVVMRDTSLLDGIAKEDCLSIEGPIEHRDEETYNPKIPTGTIELDQISEGMPSFTRMRLVHKELEAKPDADGELRELDLDAVVELDIKIYEEEPLELVEDLYATDREIDVVREENQFDKILTNTTGKCKITDRMKYDPTDRILQICPHD